jgi:hypothetical protein
MAVPSHSAGPAGDAIMRWPTTTCIQLARDSNAVSDPLYRRLAAFLSPTQLVDLTAAR